MSEPRIQWPTVEEQRERTTQLVDLAEEYEIYDVWWASKELCPKTAASPEKEVHVELREPGVAYDLPSDTPHQMRQALQPLRICINGRHLRHDGASHALARWVYWWLVGKVNEAETVKQARRVVFQANSWRIMFGVDAPRMEVL